MTTHLLKIASSYGLVFGLSEVHKPVVMCVVRLKWRKQCWSTAFQFNMNASIICSARASALGENNSARRNSIHVKNTNLQCSWTVFVVVIQKHIWRSSAWALSDAKMKLCVPHATCQIITSCQRNLTYSLSAMRGKFGWSYDIPEFESGKDR